jgi:hypothetical protein
MKRRGKRKEKEKNPDERKPTWSTFYVTHWKSSADVPLPLT